MLVKLLVEISGSRNGKSWPKRGEVIDLPAAEAVHMLNARLVERAPEQATVETAVAKPTQPDRPQSVDRKPRRKPKG